MKPFKEIAQGHQEMLRNFWEQGSVDPEAEALTL
jgi:hypothetical protein